MSSDIFKFVVLEKFLSVEHQFSLRDGLLLKGYFMLKHFGQSDIRAFGLDKCDAVREEIPMTYHKTFTEQLTRHN